MATIASPLKGQSPTISVEGRPIGAGHSVFVIAEIGINHNGVEDQAAALIDAAADAGADAVKFQVVDASASYLPGTASYAEFSGRALSYDAYLRLNSRARALDVVPFATPGDSASLAVMLATGMKAIKISSGQMTNVPLLRAVAQTGLPVIASSGMADAAGVAAMLATLTAAGAREIAVLHCTSLYPAPASTLNLRAIPTLAKCLPHPVGYSDHYMGPEGVLAAVALGATVIEKHISLDRSKPGADHHLSAEPAEFAAMVRSIRAIEAMLGTGEKVPTAEEASLAPERWRYLVAGRNLALGEVLLAEFLVPKRVSIATGCVRACDIDRLVGRRLLRPVQKDEPLCEHDTADTK